MRIKKVKQDWVERRKEKKEKERRSVFFKTVYYFLLVVFCGVTVYVFVFSDFLKINRVNLEGLEELKYEEVAKELNILLEGKYFEVISRNNFILISERKITNHLMEKFKKISGVEVKKIFPDAIEVKIAERDSLLLWCSGGPCYFIDEGGYAYNGADFESREVKENNLIRLADASAKPVDLGEKVLSEEYIGFVLRLVEEIKKESPIDILDECQTACRVAEDVRLKTVEGWDIYFSGKISEEKSVRVMKTFLEKEMDEEKRKNLEYLDLRAENKVYYKFKNLEEREDSQGEKSEEESRDEKTEIGADNNQGEEN